MWKKQPISIKYFNNGKTNGVAPIQKNVAENTLVTIKNQGSMKRKGYKFKGWSTKPNAIKSDSKFAPGKKINLTKPMKLYAVWHR